MNNTNYIFEVGKHKGEWDFAINGAVELLTNEEMNEFRSMIIVAIGTAEGMWRRAQERKHPTVTLRT